MKNEVKEKPIPFSGGMVQAILDGRKTQTRRIVKLPSDIADDLDGRNVFDNYPHGIKYKRNDGTVWRINCPYGYPGDVLWVRETYTVLEPEHIISGKMSDRFAFKADVRTSESEEIRKEYIKVGYPYKWKSSRFMPKEACRIKLLIEDIMVERLQEISDDDAVSEGIQTYCLPKISKTGSGEKFYNEGDYPTDHYQTLWESINGKGSWDANPFVWVIKFKRILP